MANYFSKEFLGGQIVEDLNQHFRMIITPECATEMLERNEGNRSLRNGIVKKYSRLMREGLWNANVPESITFTADGKLIDGQHRLNAIVDADVPVALNVTILARGASHDGIDVGAKRCVKDILLIEHGKRATNSTLSSVAAFIRYREMNFRPTEEVTKISISEIEIIDEFNKDSDTWLAVTDLVRKGNAVPLASIQFAILATYMAIKCGVSESLLENFYSIVNSGSLCKEASFEQNNTALLARKYLLDLKANRAAYKHVAKNEGLMEEYIHIFVDGDGRKCCIRKPTWFYTKEYGERYGKR